ncbi:hypothetical protein TELCIR_16746 [Teladorsagia circumcincta]|uniref:Uncharacterized protein n=1 Tax=Teladorsagia circumcincta TaxID=45464 RepID=A0A2G9TUN2_TELCI|nr:hypothetical protein TELCIR_16746 [Teladorsagia circumcincta]
MEDTQEAMADSQMATQAIHGTTTVFPATTVDSQVATQAIRGTTTEMQEVITVFLATMVDLRMATQVIRGTTTDSQSTEECKAITEASPVTT